MQMVIVILILVATVLLTVRWIVRAAKGNDGGCGCGCGNCPMNGSKDCHCRDKAAGLPEKDFDD